MITTDFVLAHLCVAISFYLRMVKELTSLKNNSGHHKNRIPSRPTEESATDAHGFALRGTPRILLQRSFMPRMSWVSMGLPWTTQANPIEQPERVICYVTFRVVGFAPLSSIGRVYLDWSVIPQANYFKLVCFYWRLPVSLRFYLRNLFLNSLFDYRLDDLDI